MPAGRQSVPAFESTRPRGYMRSLPLPLNFFDDNQPPSLNFESNIFIISVVIIVCQFVLSEKEGSVLCCVCIGVWSGDFGWNCF